MYDIGCVGDPQAELVRHFLIEPTPKGVKLKGCSNEPVFGKIYCQPGGFSLLLEFTKARKGIRNNSVIGKIKDFFEHAFVYFIENK